MDNLENISQTVKDIFAKRAQTTADKITDDTDIVKDLSLDSLASVEIALDIEEEFKIEIADIV